MATVIGTAFGILFFACLVAIPVLSIVAMWDDM
jgi:hypothetical protein